MSDTLINRVLFLILILLCVFHASSLGRVIPVGVLEGWYASPAYTHFKFGEYYDPMSPGLVEYEGGHFGQGKLRYLLQSWSFELMGFGYYQARFPMLVGGLFAVYLIYLIGKRLFGKYAGPCSALLFLLSPMFYNTHATDSHSWVAACFLLAAYFSLRLLSERRSIFGFAAGLSIGLGVSFHLTGTLGVIPLTVIFLYFRFRKNLETSHVLLYFAGGLLAFLIWCLLEILPVGLDAFVNKATYGVGVAKAHFIGEHWIGYFVLGRRGTIVELPILLFVLGSFNFYLPRVGPRYLYLMFAGLVIAYTLFSGSGSLITVWVVFFVLVGGLLKRLLDTPLGSWTFSMKTFSGLLTVVLLYYGAVQLKRIHTAINENPGEQYEELVAALASHIPGGNTIMGSPLYFFGLAGRNPYITQSFYWERMNKQTGELGDFDKQTASVSSRKMIAFLKRRGVEYLIADQYFQAAIRRWIPETQWPGLFKVETKLQSSIYGQPSSGGTPPYEIQVWHMKGGDTL